MEEITLEQVPRKIRDLYEKAMSAINRGNASYGQEMLNQVIALEPRFLLARQNLRIVPVELEGELRQMRKKERTEQK